MEPQNIFACFCSILRLINHTPYVAAFFNYELLLPATVLIAGTSSAIKVGIILLVIKKVHLEIKNKIS